MKTNSGMRIVYRTQTHFTSIYHALEHIQRNEHKRPYYSNVMNREIEKMCVMRQTLACNRGMALISK